MDYPSTGSGQAPSTGSGQTHGTELFKYQWDFIHNPEGGWFVFEDSEEGAAVSFDAFNFIQELRKAALKNEEFNFSKIYNSPSPYLSNLGPVIKHNLKLNDNKTFNILIYLHKVHPDTANNSIAPLSYVKSTYNRKVHYVNSKEYRTFKWNYSKREVEGVEIAVPEDQADEFECQLVRGLSPSWPGAKPESAYTSMRIRAQLKAN